MLNDQSDLLGSIESFVGTSVDGVRCSLTVERAIPMGRGYRVKFVGIDDRDAAEALRGCRLSVPREALPELEEGEAYLVDLIGAKVFGPDGVELGEITGIQNYPSVESLVIRRDDGTTMEQPYVDDWIESIDVQQKRVVLSALDGLL